MTDEPTLRTTVTDGYTVEIPESLRTELQLEPGDTIQWDITDSGRLLADVVEDEDES